MASSNQEATLCRTSLIRIILICLFAGGCFHDCHEKTGTVIGPTSHSPSSFTVRYHHRSASVEFTTQIGSWMHRERRFHRDAIANWLGVPHEDKELLEPINVLWVDASVRTEEGARINVVGFLGDCGFRREGDVFFGLVPRHSSGYSAWTNDEWRMQYDPDDAWVEGFLGGQFPNNHGRIFPAFPVQSTTNQEVYVTTGAFSREGGYGTAGVDCAVNRERCHRHLSFNQARDKLRCGARNWRVAGPVDLGNAYPASIGLSFTTGDHNGALVFER